MKIVHFSDWHGRNVSNLPEADVYVCTGDMLPNYPLLRYQNMHGDSISCDSFGMQNIPSGYSFVGRDIQSEREKKLQTEFASKWNFREKFFGSSDAPVVVVRGNHDFIDLSSLFGGEVWEIKDDPTQTKSIQGVKFGGVRGIPLIEHEWADELDEAEFNTRARGLPDDIDVLVTHAPPNGILDYFTRNLGSQALRWYVNKRFYNKSSLKAHLFGHIHEANMIGDWDGTIFSNAATYFKVVEL